jgi:hypothetical protein
VTGGSKLKSAIITVRPKAARIIPPGLLPDTPEEHTRQADVAEARCGASWCAACAGGGTHDQSGSHR